MKLYVICHMIHGDGSALDTMGMALESCPVLEV